MKFQILFLFLGVSVTAGISVAADKPSPVTTAKVVTEILYEEITLTGTAEAMRQSAISPRVAGVVNQVFVNEGDWIEAGQTILSLDAVIAELEVAAGRAKIAEAVARHKDAVRRKQEYDVLIESKAVATTSLASAVADAEAARALVSKERAELARLRELLARHTLTAPFAGVVAEKNVEAGQWVKADDAAIKLVALDRIRIRASLPQRYYSQIDKHASARIVFDALPNRNFTGTPSALVAVGQQSTRTFPILIDLRNDERAIAPGMSARIFIEIATQQKQALLVPRDAIVLRADGSRVVWRVEEGDGDANRVSPVKIRAGRAQGELTEVLDSTLEVGDQVVLLGNENLRAGQTVKLSRTR